VSRLRTSPYLLIVLVPVSLVTLLAGVLNFASFSSIRDQYLISSEHQALEIGRIAAATHINQETAAIQRLVSATLEQAAAGQLDEGGVYRVHVDVVNRLAALERQMPTLRSDNDFDHQIDEARTDFGAYRNFIVQATDLAAVDPPGAMHHAYQAANAYVALSEHTHAIAEAVALGAAQSSEAQAAAFQGHAAKITLIGGLLVGALLLLWFSAARWLTRRLSRLTDALQALADGNFDPSSLVLVQKIVEDRHSILRGIARAVLAFRDAIVSRNLAEERLLDKNEALQRSNAELEAFAYAASHDLREPLRNVTAFSTLLTRRLAGRLRDDEPELLKIISDAAVRMNTLVLGLLEVSEVGRSETQMAPVALSGVLATVLNGLRTQVEAVGATIDVQADLPTVMGCEIELSRVFTNIVANAIKYRGEAALVLTVKCIAMGEKAWRLEFRDNGIGIESNQGYEERIFGLFQRLHQRDEYAGGAGIGLTLCRKIINRHGGRMWAESKGLGKGSTFAIMLPRV
jgi:signal transduction histidine kinase